MERDCESELSKLNIEQNACIYHFGASVIHGQRSNILRLPYKRYKEKVTYNFYDDKLEIIRTYDRTIIEWKNITCCNIKKNLCWLGYGNKGLVINGDEFSFGTEEQFITFIKNKNHININLE